MRESGQIREELERTFARFYVDFSLSNISVLLDE